MKPLFNWDKPISSCWCSLCFAMCISPQSRSAKSLKIERILRASCDEYGRKSGLCDHPCPSGLGSVETLYGYTEQTGPDKCVGGTIGQLGKSYERLWIYRSLSG